MKKIKRTKTGYYGFDNLNNKDERSKQWEKERKKQGFDETETWSLGDTIILFTIPRLKYFIKIEEEQQQQETKFIKKLKRIKNGLELFIKENGSRNYTEKEAKEVKKALKDFGKILPKLWN
jgi:hypothetical protein